MITKRGLQEVKKYDKKLYQLTSRCIDKNKLTAFEFAKQIDRWVSQLKVRTGDMKTSYRKPSKVYHSLSKVGSIGRPLDVIHMDLADVNRLNPDNQRYLLESHKLGKSGCTAFVRQFTSTRIDDDRKPPFVHHRDIREGDIAMAWRMFVENNTLDR